MQALSSEAPLHLARRRRAWAVIGGVLAIYALGFALFPPGGPGIFDEACYVAQAEAFAKGELRVSTLDARSGAVERVLPSTYPPGTSALAAPFVWAFGPRWAALASLLSLIAATLLLARWLEREGLSPLFALLLPGYLPVLVLGRMTMSDIPSALLTTAALVAFFGGERRARPWFLAGLLAGLSTLFREPNALVLAPLFAGAVVRRERGAWAIVAGGLIGLLARASAQWALFGSAFFTRPNSGFSIAGLLPRLGFHVLVLLVLVPGGLLAALMYRGRRAAEVRLTGVALLLFFAFFAYDAHDSAGLKQLVLGPRYFIPLVPLLAYAVAWQSARLDGRRVRAVTGAWVAGIGAAAFVVHPVMARWTGREDAIRAAIYRDTTPGGLLVIERASTEKFLTDAAQPRAVIGRAELAPEALPELRARHKGVQVVLIERGGTAFWRALAAADRGYLARAQRRCELEPVLDRDFGTGERLRIWNVVGCDDSAKVGSRGAADH